jgi:hypothetical protein
LYCSVLRLSFCSELVWSAGSEKMLMRSSTCSCV